jgi:hypothetical protein
MAQYAILIYEDKAVWADPKPEDMERAMQEHGAFTAANQAALRGGEALQPTTTATTIRRDAAGGFAVTDGPFAETKEALGGFYLIEAADLDEAVAIAKQVPAGLGGVEVRPLIKFD